LVSLVVIEGIMLIVGVVTAGMLSNAVLGQVSTFDSFLIKSTETQKDILLTKTKIIYATNSSNSVSEIWVKNIGDNTIGSLDKMDLFFGKVDQTQRITYNAQTNPTWSIDGDPLVWKPADTLKIVLTNDVMFESGMYTVIVTAPNGVECTYILTI
jgi:archaellum component FlaG (FlaF/FlaG flagellin family)